MKEPPGKFWREIFLKKHFYGIGEGLEKADHPKFPDIGTIGPDPVLDNRALFPFHPCQIQGDQKKPDQCADNFNQYDNPITHCTSRKNGISFFMTSRMLSGEENWP